MKKVRECRERYLLFVVEDKGEGTLKLKWRPCLFVLCISNLELTAFGFFTYTISFPSAADH